MFTAPDPDRQRWLTLFARAPAGILERFWQAYLNRHSAPRWSRIRGPEPGLVMLRGRVGGDGQPFNLGEMTVTRCTIRLADGTVGHGYVPGIEETGAEIAAVLDGLLHDPIGRGAIEQEILEPLEHAEAERATAEARRAAATKVEFFTLVRGA